MMKAMTFRPHEKNPLDPRCKPALRRICGVCRHFTGETICAVGRCNLHQYEDLRGMISAADCEDFERPVVLSSVKGVRNA